MSEESTDAQAMDSNQVAYEQLLLVLCGLYIAVGHHGRTDDERPMNDIIQRRPEAWVRTLDEESWKSLARAFTFISPMNVKSKDLKEWTNHVLDELRRLAKRTPDQIIHQIKSEEFSWKDSVYLVCLYCGVASAHPDMSKYWEQERLAWLTDKLSGSVMFPDPRKLKSALNSVALLLTGCNFETEPNEEDPLPKPSQLIIPGTNNMKRPSCENLQGPNAKALKRD